MPFFMLMQIIFVIPNNNRIFAKLITIIINMIRHTTITILISLLAFLANVQGQTFTVVTPSNHTVYFQIENGEAEVTFKTYGMPNIVRQ